jgi:DNA-binding NarL/FixJ family response regulator
MSSAGIRVLLVDPHRIVRQGLRLLMEMGGLIVVGQTGSGAEAVALCAKFAPDVVLVDPALPDLGGTELLNAIRSGAPRARVVVLTADAGRDLVAEGASGYLLKHIDSEGLLSAIRHAVGGQCGPKPSDDPRLTPRERQVLDLVARGLTNKVIAKELHLRPGTVRAYLSEILLKLGAANRTEAAVIGVHRGLVEESALRRG